MVTIPARPRRPFDASACAPVDQSLYRSITPYFHARLLCLPLLSQLYRLDADPKARDQQRAPLMRVGDDFIQQISPQTEHTCDGARAGVGFQPFRKNHAVAPFGFKDLTTPLPGIEVFLPAKGQPIAYSTPERFVPLHAAQ